MRALPIAAAVLGIVGVPLLMGACGGDDGKETPAPRIPRASYFVENAALRDPTGRTLVMRGVNLAGAHKYKPYLSSFLPADYARLQTDWGFNAIRFLVTWAGLEPTRGVYDEVYLGEIEKRIGWARDAGLLVVVDMHQDLFGEGFAGGDGAPRWTCDDARYAAYKQPEQFFFGYLDPNVQACFDALWTNNELRGHLVEAWRRLAERLAKYENVIGFDPLNEPFWGTYPIGQFEADRLAPFYAETTRAIRSVAPNWLVFAEPSSSRNLGVASTLPKLPLDGVVYSPHVYDPTAESGLGFDPSHRESILFKVADMKAEADLVGAPLWIGEYGGQADKPGIAEYMTADYDAAGAAAASTMYWAYDKDEGYALLGKDGAEKKALADALTRPYPERTAGKLLSYAFAADTAVATIRWERDESIVTPTEIVVPLRLYPRGVLVECGGCTVEEVPGLVRLRTSPPGDPITVTLHGR